MIKMYNQICIALILSITIIKVHTQNPPLNKLINYLPDITQNYSIAKQIYIEISNNEKLKASKQVFKPPLSSENKQPTVPISSQVKNGQKSAQSKIQKASTELKNTIQTQNKAIRINKYPQFQVTNTEPQAQKQFNIQDIKEDKIIKKDNEKKFEQNQIFKDLLKQLKTATDLPNTKTRPQKTVIQKQLFNFLRPNSRKRQKKQLNLIDTQNAQKNDNFQQPRNNDQKPANTFQQVQNQHFNKKKTFSQPFNKPATFVKNQDQLQQMIVTNLQKSQLAYKLRNKQIKIENLPNVHIPQKQIPSHFEVQNVQIQQFKNGQKKSQQKTQIFSKNVIKSLFSILLIGSIFIIALSYTPNVNSKRQGKAYKPSQDQEIYLR